MRDALVDWIAANVGQRFAGSSVDRIGVGHSRAMYRVTAPDGTRLVARVEQGGVFGTDSAEECRVMRALAERGFPVAAIVGDDLSGTAIGRPFFVMEFLEGAEAADERSLDGETAAAFVDALTRLHQLDPSGIEFDIRVDDPSRATPAQVERWRDIYRGAADKPIPLLEEASSWLLLHAPPLERLAVVHGDAGPGNFVHAGGAVVAVTDWEFAHAGDPAEDWAFCLTMRGSRTMPREEWLRLFHERAGVQLTAAEWRYWEAFNLFKGACANRTCLAVFEDGRNRAPNMAIIGTALHQMFLRRLVAIVHDEGDNR
jgi:aminoglycoside phosphotransferase (APT) family kinase protein